MNSRCLTFAGHVSMQDTVPAYLRAKPWLWPSEEAQGLTVATGATGLLPLDAGCSPPSVASCHSGACILAAGG